MILFSLVSALSTYCFVCLGKCSCSITGPLSFFLICLLYGYREIPPTLCVVVSVPRAHNSCANTAEPLVVFQTACFLAVVLVCCSCLSSLPVSLYSLAVTASIPPLHLKHPPCYCRCWFTFSQSVDAMLSYRHLTRVCTTYRPIGVSRRSCSGTVTDAPLPPLLCRE